MTGKYQKQGLQPLRIIAQVHDFPSVKRGRYPVIISQAMRLGLKISLSPQLFRSDFPMDC